MCSFIRRCQFVEEKYLSSYTNLFHDGSSNNSSHEFQNFSRSCLLLELISDTSSRNNGNPNACFNFYNSPNRNRGNTVL
jgi:hypothetical protein